jgi:hypothetical protein
MVTAILLNVSVDDPNDRNMVTGSGCVTKMIEENLQKLSERMIEVCNNLEHEHERAIADARCCASQSEVSNSHPQSSIGSIQTTSDPTNP